jgi:ATP-dependent 26S proteasome regulatory subunit
MATIPDNLTEQQPEVSPALTMLLPALRRLDQLLQMAMQSFHLSQRVETSALFRGLSVSSDDVARALSQTPGAAPFIFDRSGLDDGSGSSSLAGLLEAFGLSPFDVDLVLIALAPEIDLRYERIFAYLQDDVTRKRPTVELALNLLCSSAQEKLERRDHFSSEAPLLREGLLHLVPDPNQVEPPFLAQYLKLDDQVTRLLLGHFGLDQRLAPFCEVGHPAPDWNALPLPDGIKLALAGLVRQAHANRSPLQLYFQGPPGAGKRQAARALAAVASAELLELRADQLLERSGLRELSKLLLREAQLRRAVLYISGLDDVREQDLATRRRELLESVSRHNGITILAGKKPWVPTSGAKLAVQPIAFNILNFAESCACWSTELASHGVTLKNAAVELVASRFRLTAGQIQTALASALLDSEWRGAQRGPVEGAAPALSADDLCAAARAQCGHELGRLAKKIEPRYAWADIILPPDQMQHLQEICAQAEHRKVVYGDWGFDRKLSLGKGLNVLFSGPPGTGKTMAAEVMARELHLDLYRVDLSQVVSKYIGESEKNLDKIFTAAENSNAILFFDEADALFGKRSEVRDSHDRYANIEISYLLQKMEEYQGISILATNLRQNLDDAFMRRLQAVVEFPFPDEEYRTRIWKNVFPREAPLSPDVDFAVLAREVRLAGGNIKNMALTAAFSAAADGGLIAMEHLIQAANREHQKIGRTWDEAELRKARTR